MGIESEAMGGDRYGWEIEGRGEDGWGVEGEGVGSRELGGRWGLDEAMGRGKD